MGTSSSHPTEPSITGKSFRMVALDLDGTLLHSDHTVSDSTAAYLRALCRKGITVVVATGRAAPTVYSTIAKLDLPYPSGTPVVCSNGAKGMFCKISTAPTCGAVSASCTDLFDTPVPSDITLRVIQLAKELECTTQYYCGDEIFANPREESGFELARLYTDLTGSKTQYVTDDFAQVLERSEQKGPSKLLVLCPKDRLDGVYNRFCAELRPHANVVYGSMGWFLEVLHKDVCKGNGLKKLCKHLNIPIEECIAFGDGDNDLEFIQNAGKGIAMKNARHIIKQAADVCTKYTNNEDGVRKTLEDFERRGILSTGQESGDVHRS